MQNTRKVLAGLAIVLLLLAVQGAYARQFLFVLFDAGETNGLIPVIRKIDPAKDQVTIVAEGASTTILKRKNIPFLRLKDFVTTDNFTFQAPREIITFEHHAGYYIPLRYVSVGALPEDVFKRVRPDVLVGGLVSTMERDFFARAREAGIPTFGFFDYYDVPDPGSIFTRIIPETDYIFVNSDEIARGIAGLDIIDKDRIIVSGHPNFSRLHTLKTRWNALPDSASPYFIFTTQYSEGNDQLLNLLIRVMEADYNRFRLIIAPHPNQDPEHYINVANKSSLVIRILDREKMSVYEAMLGSEIVFTQTSTTGFEAVLLDKDLVHILPTDFEQAGLFTLRKRLALAASNKDGLKEAIRKYLEDDPAVNPIRDAVRHCYPLPRADEAILDWIEHVLQDQSRQESAGED